MKTISVRGWQDERTRCQCWNLSDQAAVHSLQKAPSRYILLQYFCKRSTTFLLYSEKSFCSWGELWTGFVQYLRWTVHRPVVCISSHLTHFVPIWVSFSCSFNPTDERCTTEHPPTHCTLICTTSLTTGRHGATMFLTNFLSFLKPFV